MNSNNDYIMTSAELERLGLPITQAKRVIHDAKKNAVKAGYKFYGGKQNFAPKRYVLEILGVIEVV